MFKPTRKELIEVQRLAHECEVDARATRLLADQGTHHWYGMHRPAQNAQKAFDLSKKIAARTP